MKKYLSRMSEPFTDIFLFIVTPKGITLHALSQFVNMESEFLQKTTQQTCMPGLQNYAIPESCHVASFLSNHFHDLFLTTTSLVQVRFGL